MIFFFWLQSLTVDSKSVLSKDYSKDPNHLVCIQGLDLPGLFDLIISLLLWFSTEK